MFKSILTALLILLSNLSWASDKEIIESANIPAELKTFLLQIDNKIPEHVAEFAWREELSKSETVVLWRKMLPEVFKLPLSVELKSEAAFIMLELNPFALRLSVNLLLEQLIQDKKIDDESKATLQAIKDSFNEKKRPEEKLRKKILKENHKQTFAAQKISVLVERKPLIERLELAFESKDLKEKVNALASLKESHLKLQNIFKQSIQYKLKEMPDFLFEHPMRSKEQIQGDIQKIKDSLTFKGISEERVQALEDQMDVLGLELEFTNTQSKIVTAKESWLTQIEQLNRDTIPYLLKAFQSKSEEVQLAAIACLMGNPSAELYFEAFTQLKNSNSAKVRWGLFFALESIGIDQEILKGFNAWANHQNKINTSDLSKLHNHLISLDKLINHKELNCRNILLRMMPL